jgi:DNA-binding transcriptional regulator LsrR (DeoR family)
MIEMARRRIAMIEIEEVLYRWLQGMSMRQIARSLGISRNTVKKLITQGQQAGMIQGDSNESRKKLGVFKLLYHNFSVA